MSDVVTENATGWLCRLSSKGSLMMMKFYEWWRGLEVAVVGGLMATYVVIAMGGTSATTVIVLCCVLTWLLEVLHVVGVKFIFETPTPYVNYVNQIWLGDGEGNFSLRWLSPAGCLSLCFLWKLWLISCGK